MTERVRAVVPELVGLTVCVVHDWVVLTLAASSEQVAGLDAVQYLDGGPCLVEQDQLVAVETVVDTVADGDGRQLFAQAAAALGVRSTLLLPLVDGDRAVGGVSLYASTADAFRGRHEDVA